MKIKHLLDPRGTAEQAKLVINRLYARAMTTTQYIPDQQKRELQKEAIGRIYAEWLRFLEGQHGNE